MTIVICTKNGFEIALKNRAFKFRKNYIYVCVSNPFSVYCLKLKYFFFKKDRLTYGSFSSVHIATPYVWWNVNEIVEFGFSWQLT